MNVPDADQGVDGRTKALKSLLNDPFAAFLAAWKTGKRQAFLRPKRNSRRKGGAPTPKRRQAFRYTEANKLFFDRILAASCTGENWGENGRSNVANKVGLDEFLKTIADLMLSWIPHHQKDDAVLRWFDAISQSVTLKMQEAQRASVTWIGRPNSMFLDGVSRPKPDVMRRFNGQKDLRQAARTAAYVLWGGFISEKPFSIAFCQRCLKPLLLTRKDKRSCTGCSKGESSNRSIKNGYRKANWKLLQKASSKLHKRLSNGRSKDDLTDLGSGRWRTRFIRAAEHPHDFDAVERLLDLCTEYGCTKEHGWEVRRVLDQFLKDIRKVRS